MVELNSGEGKRILIICKGFCPDISPRSFRATELAKELAKEGHQVKVLFPTRGINYSKFENQNHLVIQDLGGPVFKDIKIKGGRLSFLFRRLLRRGLQQLLEWPDIELMFRVNKAIKKEYGYNLLISIAVPFPIHWGVALAKKRSQFCAKTWIADCGDPYMGDKNDSFRKMFYFKYVEKWFCRKADYISIPRLELKVNFYEEFREKIVEIPQGFNFNEIKLAEYKKNFIPTFAYSGSFIRTTRNPAKLLEFLSNLTIDFKFIIYTNSNELVAPYKMRLNGKLEIREYIPRDKLIFELSKMDFNINIGFNPTTQVPSKLIDYALSGRPILVFPSNDIDEDLISEFLRGIYNRRFIIDDIDNFNIANVSRKFTSLSK